MGRPNPLNATFLALATVGGFLFGLLAVQAPTSLGQAALVCLCAMAALVIVAAAVRFSRPAAVQLFIWLSKWASFGLRKLTGRDPHGDLARSRAALATIPEILSVARQNARDGREFLEEALSGVRRAVEHLGIARDAEVGLVSAFANETHSYIRLVPNCGFGPIMRSVIKDTDGRSCVMRPADQLADDESWDEAVSEKIKDCCRDRYIGSAFGSAVFPIRFPSGSKRVYIVLTSSVGLTEEQVGLFEGVAAGVAQAFEKKSVLALVPAQ